MKRFSFLLFLASLSLNSPAYELTEHGFSKWQWMCQSETSSSDTDVPFIIEKDKNGSAQWIHNGRHPFSPDIVKEVHWENLSKSVKEPFLKLSVTFIPGVTWNGVKVQGFKSHYAPQGSFVYFETLGSPVEISHILNEKGVRSHSDYEEYSMLQRGKNIDIPQLADFNAKNMKGVDQMSHQEKKALLNRFEKFFKISYDSSQIHVRESKLGCWSDEKMEFPILFEIRSAD